MLLGSQTLNPRQAIDCCTPESFEGFAPVDKNKQVWYVLKDLTNKKIIEKKGKPKKKAMTLGQADEKNAIIRDTGFAWVRF